MINKNSEQLNRKLSPIEGAYLYAPYAIVSLASRIRGTISKQSLREAVSRLQARHPNLQRRILKDGDGNAWFQGDPQNALEIRTYHREDSQSWIQAVQAENRIPFEFDSRPAIRFLLVEGEGISDLVIFCHHTICDGLSLAFLARDLLQILGSPGIKLAALEDAQPIDQDHLPVGVKVNPIVEFAIQRINQKWAEGAVVFDQEDYRSLAEGYWSSADHQTLVLEFSREETAALVSRCKAEGVTVNSALAAALSAAQNQVQGPKPDHQKVAIAGSFRDRLADPVGEGMGIFAGAIMPRLKYKAGLGFWENTRRIHKQVTPLYTNQKLFADLLPWTYLAPGVIESLSFKLAGGSVLPDSPRSQKLREFSQREDVISAMVKREKMDSLDSVLIGTALTNLTRLDFPEKYGELQLERMILKPGGAFPLIFVNLLCGAVTSAGRLSLSLEFAERRTQKKDVVQISDRIREILLDQEI